MSDQELPMAYMRNRGQRKYQEEFVEEGEKSGFLDPIFNLWSRCVSNFSAFVFFFFQGTSTIMNTVMNWLANRGRFEEKLKFLDAVPIVFRRYKRALFWVSIMTLFVYFSYSTFKSIYKEVFYIDYTDSFNHTITNPLIFLNTDDPENPYPNPDVTIFYDHYDEDLVAWISNENKKGEKKLSAEDYARGYFVSNVYGFEKEQKISFELLKKMLVFLSKRLEGCVSAKNLGIPVDIIYLDMYPEEQMPRYMLQPEIVSQSPTENKVKYKINVRTGPNTFNSISHSEIVPEEIRVEWRKFSKSNKEGKVPEKFSKGEALCIWYQNK